MLTYNCTIPLFVDKKFDTFGVQTKSQQKQMKTPSIKCVLVGDGAVGKTNLILTYLKNRFSTEHVPTASDIYNGKCIIFFLICVNIVLDSSA